jgi:DnaJ-class molecular chaperone
MTETTTANESTATRPCGNCDGNGFVMDVRHASITHRRTEINRKCRTCKGTGKLGPITEWTPEWEDHGGKLPEWLSWMNGDE